jgi:hypothetical protein
MRSSTTRPSGSVHHLSRLSVCDQALWTAPAQTHTSCWWGGAPNLTLTARLVQATAWACINSSTPSSHMTQANTLAGLIGVETVKFPNCSGCRLLGWRKARRGRSVTATAYRTNVLRAAIYCGRASGAAKVPRAANALASLMLWITTGAGSTRAKPLRIDGPAVRRYDAVLTNPHW